MDIGDHNEITKYSGCMSLIVATDKFKGIAKNGTIPWHCPDDLKYFRSKTIGNGNNVVIMGRKTYMSLPKKYRPLSQRANIVMSATWKQEEHPDIIIINSFDQLWSFLKTQKYDEIFVIGGELVYRKMLSQCDKIKIYLTVLSEDYQCDQFFLYNENSYKTISYEKLSYGERWILEHK